MRKLSVPVTVLAACICYCAAWAQPPGGGIIFSQLREFKIPFNVGEQGNLKQIQLFYSTDQGRSWQPASIAPPEQRYLRFLSDRDGEFWFTVQTTDTQGRTFPTSLEGAQASLKVVVDSQPPNVAVDALQPRGSEVGVAWTVRDDNLDLALPDALRLEYRPASAVAWLPLSINPASAQHYWVPQGTGPFAVRLRARDRAGNQAEGSTTLNGDGQTGRPSTTGQQTAPPDRPAERGQEIFNGPSDAERRLVNSKRISLNYELKEVGPSGVSVVELWYTMDGRSWNKYPVRFGEEPTQRNIAFDVAGEGVYGLSLVAKSGVGLGDRPPQIGDRPQIWIEVDTTKPQVQLHNVLVGTGADKGKLTVSWSARDKNLEREPIVLSYAEQPTGPWKACAEKLPNTGRFVWQMPEPVPYQFHVRVEATDRAGNVGESITESLVKVDLSAPKVQILKVEPGR